MSDFPVFPIEAQAQLTFLAKILAENRAYLAAVFAIFLYEMIITFPLEYKRIWPGRISLLKVLYFMNRYATLGTLIGLMAQWYGTYSNEYCKSLQISQPIFLGYIFVVCECIIALRVWGIYGRNKLIGAILVASLLGNMALQIVAAHDNVSIPFPEGAKAFNVYGCFSNSGKSWTWAYFLAPILQSVLVICLTMWKVLQYRREGGTTPLLTLILRDGLAYFFVIFAVNLVNLIYFLAPNVTTHAMNAPLAYVVTSITCSRLVFNMRSPDAIKRNLSTYLSETGKPLSTSHNSDQSFRKKRTIGFSDNSRNKEFDLATANTVVVEMEPRDGGKSEDEKLDRFEDEKVMEGPTRRMASQYPGIEVSQQAARRVSISS